MREGLAPEAVIADKGYDADAFVERLQARHQAGHCAEGQPKEIRDCDFLPIVDAS